MFDTLKSRIYQGSQFIKDIENAIKYGLSDSLNRNTLNTALFVLKEQLNNDKNEVKKS